MTPAPLAALLIAASGAAAAAQPRPERSQHARVGALANVSFATNSDALRWGSNRTFGRVAAWAVANPRGLVVLDAHSDPRGSRAYNRELALRRAHTVRRELLEAGIPNDRIVIAAYGENGPKRENNRRVTIWGTNSGIDAVVARSERRGTTLVLRGDSAGEAVAVR